MQIISRGANEGIVIDGQTTVTVVEVGVDEVTLEIVRPDGQVERVRLQHSPTAELQGAEVELAEAVLC